MASAFGVHVGNSSTCVAVNKNGQTIVLANDAGDRVTPAIVSFNNGELAAGLMSRNACNNMVNCVRLIGHPNMEDEDVANIIARSSCKISKGLSGELFYEPTNDDGKPTKKYSAQHVLSLIYKHLLDTATSHSGVLGDRSAVLSVSSEFTDEQVTCIREAATSAGFRVLQVIREPAATLLAYDVGLNNDSPSKEDSCVVVYRVGGTSMDAAVVSVQNGLYRIVNVVHRNNLGGDELTELLTKLLAEEFKRRHKVDVTDKPRALQKLRLSAEESKRILSTLTTTNCSVESLCDGIDFTCPLSRSRLDILFNPVMTQFLGPLEEVLAKAKIQVDNVDKVILCGGTCKIPLLQQVVGQFFNSTVKILSHISPDETLAIGAANQAMHIRYQEANFGTMNAVFPTVARRICYRVSNPNAKLCKSNLVFNSGTIVPARKECRIALDDTDETDSVGIDVFETNADGDEIGSNILAKVILYDLPKNVDEIGAIFEATRDNRLRVCLKEAVTGKSESVVVLGSCVT